MADIPEERVDEHEAGFEDHEEPLISDDGAESHGVDVASNADVREAEVLDRAVYGADHDQSHGDIQGQQWTRHFLGTKATLEAPVMECPSQHAEEGNDDDLYDQRSFHQGVAEVDQAIRQRSVGGIRNSYSVQCFHETR